MTKRSKHQIRRNDYFRALLTDTLPDEVPIIFNNDNLYIHTRNKEKYGAEALAFLNELIWENNKTYSVPYKYRVFKSATTTRKLSLIHPKAQLDICEFYQQFEHLICYYNTLSPFSIRAPYKVASSVFITNPSEDANKFLPGGVATERTELIHKHPESFFAYRQYSMLHRFFSSERFLRLEQTYSCMWIGDVSKCFHSIYTHSIEWAVRGRSEAKKKGKRRSFGAEFDRLLQSQNYNETNGICIGSELSRIFAETIFQAIDCNVHREATRLGLIQGQHYDCARYVDDIHIFAKDESTAGIVYAIFDRELGNFNLHFNEGKLQKYRRPFNTEKGVAVNNADNALEQFERTLIEYVEAEDESFPVPKKLRRPANVKQALIRNLKSASGKIGSGYALISNFALGGVCAKLDRLIVAYNKVPEDQRPSDLIYFRSLCMLLETSFFLFSVNPTVSSSLKLSKAILASANFVKRENTSRYVHLTELLNLKCIDLAKSTKSDSEVSRLPYVRVEFLNIYLAVSNLTSVSQMTEPFLRDFILGENKDDDSPSYFSIICCLFIIKNNSSFGTLKAKIKEIILAHFTAEIDIFTCSETVHYLTDILSCPYLDLSFRSKILGLASKGMQSRPLAANRKAICQEMEEAPWFTNWTEVSLERLISRKQLKAAY